MRITWLSIFVVFLLVSPAFGQRDAPVWEAYLPQFSIYHDQSKSQDAITIDFLFKKNGGPVEHTEHQAYILVYLKKDEEQILKLAGDSRLVNKENEKTTKPFLDLLVEKKLVIPLESQVAKIDLSGGRMPRFPDVRGTPKRSGVDTLAKFSFPFKFTFTYETLFASVRKLGNFSAENVETFGKSTHFNDRFKFIVFVPVNNSAHATKVSPELRKTWDFAYPMDSSTALLYFRALPYELNLQTYQDKTLLIYIN
jgi:hypothetical protein